MSLEFKKINLGYDKGIIVFEEGKLRTPICILDRYYVETLIKTWAEKEAKKKN